MSSPPSVTAASPLRTYYKRHVGNLDVDWQRTTALYQAGCVAASFRAPRPISRHAQSNAIEYEHLPPGSTLRQQIHRMVLFPSSSRLTKTAGLVAHAGAALAELQCTLPVDEPRSLHIDLSPLSGLDASLVAHAAERVRKAPQVPIHGDFWQGNIWIADSDLVLFDPLPSPHSPDPAATLGPIYYDVSHMIFSLWAVYPAWLIPLHRLDWIQMLCRHFLTGYESAGSCVLDRVTAHVLALYWLDRYLELMPARLGRAVTAIRRPLIRGIRDRLLKEIHRWTTIERAT